MGNNLFKIFDKDKDTDEIKKVDQQNLYIRQILKAKEDMTGWERVKIVFSKNEFGEVSPEFQRCFDASLIAMVVGAGLGGIGRSRIAYMDFFRQNTHTAFETPLQAKRMLQDTVYLGMGSGAWRIGWRMTAFTFMYMSTATAIAAYRGKIGIVDQVGGAGFAGFLYKFRDGPKAAVSGTVMGSLLGLVAGSITLVAVSVFGLNLEQANSYYYNRLAQKQEKDRQRLLSLRENAETDDTEMDGLTKFHEKMFGTTAAEAPKDYDKTNKNIKNTSVASTALEDNLKPIEVELKTKSSTESV